MGSDRVYTSTASQTGTVFVVSNLSAELQWGSKFDPRPFVGVGETKDAHAGGLECALCASWGAPAHVCFPGVFQMDAEVA